MTTETRADPDELAKALRKAYSGREDWEETLPSIRQQWRNAAAMINKRVDQVNFYLLMGTDKIHKLEQHGGDWSSCEQEFCMGVRRVLGIRHD